MKRKKFQPWGIVWKLKMFGIVRWMAIGQEDKTDRGLHIGPFRTKEEAKRRISEFVPKRFIIVRDWEEA